MTTKGKIKDTAMTTKGKIKDTAMTTKDQLKTVVTALVDQGKFDLAQEVLALQQKIEAMPPRFPEGGSEVKK